MGRDVIIACDFSSAEKTFEFLDKFEGKKPFVKIGMELYYAEGPSIVREIKKRGHKIFLDLKLHDIPNTVKKAMSVLSGLDVDMTNLHAQGTVGMMKAAIEGLTKPDGTRPILIEIQALVCGSNFGVPRRTAAGTDYNRVNLLMAVLEKRLGLHLSNYDAYVNIAGGVKMNEPAIDLGIVMAIVSSYKNKAIDEKTIVFGEVGLSGEVRAVSMPEQRVAEAKKLGFETCIMPEVSKAMVKGIQGIKIIGVKNIGDAVGLLG